MTLDPRTADGASLRVVVECKDRAVSGRAMREELQEARRNRDAAVALVVFSAAHAPAGIAPFDVRTGDVYCALDPDGPEPATLEAALRLARLLAVASMRRETATLTPQPCERRWLASLPSSTRCAPSRCGSRPSRPPALP